MNYNPYAAPQAAPPPPPGGGGPGFSGSPQPWDIGEVLSASAEAFKANAGLLIGAMLVFVVLILPVGGLPTALTLGHVMRPGGFGTSIFSIGCSLLNMVVQAFLMTGLVRIFLAVARGQQATLGDLFSGGSHFLPMLGVTVLTAVITVLGCGCFGIVLIYLGLCFAQYFVVDQNLGPIEALTAAWRVAEGQRGQVLLYSLVALLLTIAGLALCGVGAFVTAPIAMLGFTIIYLRITGRGGPAPAGGYGPPPGGGYGPPPGGGYGPPPGGGGYGPPPGGGGYGPPPGGGGYGGPPPQGGPGPFGGGGYGPGGGTPGY